MKYISQILPVPLLDCHWFVRDFICLWQICWEFIRPKTKIKEFGTYIYSLVFVLHNVLVVSCSFHLFLFVPGVQPKPSWGYEGWLLSIQHLKNEKYRVRVTFLRQKLKTGRAKWLKNSFSSWTQSSLLLSWYCAGVPAVPLPQKSYFGHRSFEHFPLLTLALKPAAFPGLIISRDLWGTGEQLVWVKSMGTREFAPLPWLPLFSLGTFANSFAFEQSHTDPTVCVLLKIQSRKQSKIPGTPPTPNLKAKNPPLPFALILSVSTSSFIYLWILHFSQPSENLEAEQSRLFQQFQLSRKGSFHMPVEDSTFQLLWCKPGAVSAVAGGCSTGMSQLALGDFPCGKETDTQKGHIKYRDDLMTPFKTSWYGARDRFVFIVCGKEVWTNIFKLLQYFCLFLNQCLTANPYGLSLSLSSSSEQL